MTLPSSNKEQYPVLAVGRSYDFGFVRQALQGTTLDEGIAPTSSIYGTAIPGDLAVTTSGSGLGLTIAAGRAWVKGDSSISGWPTGSQGIYFNVVDSAQALTMATADGANPRIDRVILRVYDSDVDGSGQIKWVVEKVTGTPTAGATLVNLNGAAAVPNTALLLANVLTPAGFAGPYVNATHISDQRNLASRSQACIMTKATQAIGAGAITQITLNTTGLDNNRMADTTNNRINIQVAGLYVMHARMVSGAAGTAGANRIAYIYKNGAAIQTDARDSVAGANFDSVEVQGIAYLVPGDYVDARLISYTDALNWDTNFEVVRIA